jgi:hypothetical protein
MCTKDADEVILWALSLPTIANGYPPDAVDALLSPQKRKKHYAISGVLDQCAVGGPTEPRTWNRASLHAYITNANGSAVAHGASGAWKPSSYVA